MENRLLRAVLAEATGSFLLFAGVVGSGIMGERLAGGNAAVALLGNSIATGAILYVLIAMLAPLSGAHFNPAVTLAMAGRGSFPWRRTAPWIAAQVLGGVLGVICANLMFGLPAVEFSHHARSGPGTWLGEIVATAGLVLTILGTSRHRPQAIPAAVALYIVAAYWFTSSTSFANPAITLARSLSDTFAGIAPADVPGFVVAQLAGAAIGALLGKALFD